MDDLFPDILLCVVRLIKPVTSVDRFGPVTFPQHQNSTFGDHIPPKKVNYGAGEGINYAFSEKTQNAKFRFSNTLSTLLIEPPPTETASPVCLETNPLFFFLYARCQRITNVYYGESPENNQV